MILHITFNHRLVDMGILVKRKKKEKRKKEKGRHSHIVNVWNNDNFL